MKQDDIPGVAIALAGNPNVGKSTVFNALTGMRQHTGNWPGKTVSNAQGTYSFGGREYTLVDLPGTYSLAAHSAEEEVARDYILSGSAQATVVVCDATSMERNLNLVLQIMQLTNRVLVCVNLLDEARKKGMQLDLPALQMQLGVPVVGCSARSGDGLEALQQAIADLCSSSAEPQPIRIEHDQAIQQAIAPLESALSAIISGEHAPAAQPAKSESQIDPGWLALDIIKGNGQLPGSLAERLGISIEGDLALSKAYAQAQTRLQATGIDTGRLADIIIGDTVRTAERIAQQVLTIEGAETKHSADAQRRRNLDRQLDRLFTSRATGIPIMLALLAGILWLTIVGSNYPSQLLSNALFSFESMLSRFLLWLGTPAWLESMLVQGVYRVLAWVVAVMLPPMAIFFPLFTLLEDFGYLPRVAFNLDQLFKRAGVCGKQALTM